MTTPLENMFRLFSYFFLERLTASRMVCSLFLISAINSGCASDQVGHDTTGEGTLVFQSGFEGTSEVVSRNSDSDLVGVDETLPSHNDWNKFDDHPSIGSFNIQYQGGDESMRYARIVADPKDPENQVLHFWLDQPNVDQKKGRIQANIYGNTGLKEIYQSVRVFLPDDFNTVKTFPQKIHWLTIAEFWNNITWSQEVPYGFRITLGIGKPSPAEGDLHFILDAQDCELFDDGKQKYTTLWAETNTRISVPIGKWFTMNYYYKEGDNTSGRFWLSIKPDGGIEQEVFDVRKTTHHSNDPQPDGLGHFNPLKLYTSKELIAHMKSHEKTLQIYWDDFKLWKDKMPKEQP